MRKNSNQNKHVILIHKRRTITFMVLLFVIVGSIHAQFVHPGITHKKSDLDRMKYMVEAQVDPWYTSYQDMVADSKSSYNYVVQGNESFTLLARDSPKTNYNAWNSDIRAAYYNAIRWYVTGDSRHAEKAIEIFNAWRNLTSVTSGGTDSLSGGIGYIMIEAAEIIKSTYPGWAPADLQAFKDMLVYPGYSSTTPVTGANKTFYWMSYQGDPGRHGNQGLSGWRTVMAMGIFLDNDKMYDRALKYINGNLSSHLNDIPYPAGPRTTNALLSSTAYVDTYSTNNSTSTPNYGYNEVMTNYIWENGQCQESSRDQQHTAFGIGLLTSMAEMAWNQGDDLYSHANDRLLLGLEYNLRYNVSAIQSYPDQTTPWVPTGAEFIQRLDRTARWYSKAISPDGIGDYAGVRTVFEMPVAHYIGRGFKTEAEVKWTQRARDKYITLSGYEKAGWTNDAIGWGALTARRPNECYGDPISGFDSNGLPIYAMNVLPMTIEAENFDYSAFSQEDRTYNETTTANRGGKYRTTEAVDIEDCSEGGYNVGWITNGEWLTYTVYVPNTGSYNISLRYASTSSNGTIKVLFGGTDKTSFVSVPSTGNYQVWNNLSLANNVTLTKGVQSMKILVGTGGFNINNISITTSTPVSNTFTIQESGTGFCSVDGTVDSNNAGFTGSGFANTTNAIEQGVDWKIGGSAGNYTFTWRYASTSNRPSNLIVNGSVVASNIAFNTTGSWTTWTTVSRTVSLPLGAKTVRLESTTSSGLGNIDYLEVTGPDAVELSCASSSKLAGGKDVLSVDTAIENSRVSIYPNPVSSKLAVVVPISKFNNYTVYDISGRATMRGSIAGNLEKINIDVSHLSKGIYMISIKGNQTTETIKFIKE